LEQGHRAGIGAGLYSRHWSRVIEQALEQDHSAGIGTGS